MASTGTNASSSDARNRPVPRGVCHWCSAAKPGVPDAVALLFPAGAAGLCSHWCPPSAENEIHIYFTLTLVGQNSVASSLHGCCCLWIQSI